MPSVPYILSITVKQEDGSPRANSGIQITNQRTRNKLTEVSNASGQVVFDLGNFTEDWNQGDNLVIEKIGKGIATTSRFAGKIDRIINKTEGGVEVLTVTGGHISSELLDLTVTREYTGEKSCDEILKEIIDSYLTGYTYTNVNTSTVSPNIKWSNKPFWSCVEDLCRFAVATSDVIDTKKRFDCYVDDDKDFHFFAENSVDNSDDAIVWGDTLINLEGFGEEQTLVKNKIIVYGDAGGLPIISVSENGDSQDLYGLKENVITNTDIISYDSALDISLSSLGILDISEDQGNATCFVLPTIQPGQRIWVTEPTMKITKQIKISKYAHMFPLENSQVILTKDRNVSSILRDQNLKDIAQDDIINPYEMIKSINFTFDDFNNISSKDGNIEIIDGKIKLSSGTTGTFTSDTFIQKDDISQVHLLIVGEKTTSMIIKVSTDGGDTLETVNVNELSNVTPGKNLVIKVQLNSTDTELDSLALLIK